MSSLTTCLMRVCAGRPNTIYRVARRLSERDQELATLVEAASEAAAGTGSVVLLHGEAGIGKTSLASAIKSQLPTETRMLIGSCDALGTPRTLGPFRDLAPAVGPRLAEALATGAITSAGSESKATTCWPRPGRHPALPSPKLISRTRSWAGQCWSATPPMPCHRRWLRVSTGGGGRAGAGGDAEQPSGREGCPRTRNCGLRASPGFVRRPIDAIALEGLTPPVRDKVLRLTGRRVALTGQRELLAMP
jgi:hypothetical protein